MKIEEFRELSDADLTAKVSELRANLMTLRFQQKSGQLDNGKKLTAIRKDIACALTVESERRHGIKVAAKDKEAK